MEKYDKRIIDAYINGNDTENYSIEELENDKKFMMMVITLTNDKNFYNLCSEELKGNYEFVRFVIQKFNIDINFICKVADFYLNVVEDELTRTELVILMADLTKDKNEQKNHEYEVIRDTIFTTKRVQIEIAKANTNDEYASNEIGMGFLIVFDSFNSSKIVLNYYAKKIIEAIFDEYNINLENMLHEQFGNPDQINKIGINNYMLNFIGVYDSMLASYLNTNIDLMQEFSNKIKVIQKRWNQYENSNERKKYNLIFEKVHEYMEQTENEGMFSETDLLYYVCQKLGIINKLVKYDGVPSEFEDTIVDGLDEEFLNDTLNVSFIDRVHFNNVKRIISSIAFSNNYDIQESPSNENTKGKILKINFNNKL